MVLSAADWREVQRRVMMADLLEYCHPSQRAFVVSRGKRKAALCGRRSGKTAALAVQLLLATLMHPGELCIAIALSRANARELYGAAIRRVCKSIGVECAETTRDGAFYMLPETGGRILLGGCSDRHAVDAYRGDRSPLVVIDEADSMRPWLGTLVEDVVEPRLVDLRGTLILTGTPGATADGYFHRITTGSEWEVFRWNMLSNPHIPSAPMALENARKTRDEGTYQREWLGNWFTDLAALCYPCEQANLVTAKEAEAALLGYDVRTVIGVDIGFDDPCSWVVVQHVPGIPVLWVVEVQTKSGLTPSAAAARTMAIRDKYPRARVVVDTGGIGKGYAEEWRQHHGVVCEVATKADVGGSIAEVAGALRAGTLRVVERKCQPLLDEWSVLQWDEAHKGHMQGQSDHCSDALRYAFRAIGGVRSNPELELSALERAAAEERKERQLALSGNLRRLRRAGQ